MFLSASLLHCSNHMILGRMKKLKVAGFPVDNHYDSACKIYIIHTYVALVQQKSSNPAFSQKLSRFF